MVAIDELAPDLVRRIYETFVAIGGDNDEIGLAHMLATGSRVVATGSRGPDPSVRPPIDSSSSSPLAVNSSPLAVNSFSPDSGRAYLG